MNSEPSIPALPPMPADVACGRVPRWTMDRLDRRACPVCESLEPIRVCTRPDGLEVARCTQCGMTYLPSIPGRTDLEAFYRDYDAHKQLPGTRTGLLARVSPLRWPHPYVEILRETGGLSGQRLCEVGCSYGGFLLDARRAGARVSGVELDERALAALSSHGIAAAKQIDERQRQDIVCAFELIEHLAHPGEWVQQVSRVLEPGGRLLLSMPNGAEAARIGPSWIGFRVDLEHLNYFDVGTLARLLGASGLYVEHHWEARQPNLRPRARRGAGGMLTRWLLQLTGQPSIVNGSFGLVVLARKPGP